jgi:hypothetical protein
MNSIHRVALAIAFLMTGGAVAAAFVVDGYMSANQAAIAAASATQNPQVVYILPTSSPAPLGTPPVIHVVVPGTGDDDNGR